MDARDGIRTVLPPRAQPLLAAAVACGLVAGAAWYVAAGGLSGGLVHHDAPPAVAGPTFTVNLNTAPAAELAQLPGIGPATAGRIVDHRREHGPFASVDGLLAVPGIGPATLEALRPHLRPLPADR